MQVTYFQRKPRIGNNSLEFIFEDVRQRLRECVTPHVRVAPFFSNGLFRRAAIMMDAWRHEGQISHITGDITFAALLLDRDRTVVTILDCGDVEFRGGVAGWLLRNLWYTWPARHAALITTISEVSRRDIIRITGCEPEKVVVIPVAVSEQFQFRPKTELSLPPRILQVGTSPNKNLERLAEALRGVECTLVVVGELTATQRVCFERHNVRYENYVGIPHEEVVRQYELCDMVVFASLFEGFGMPIVEAQVVGRPVVTSNISSMPEVAGAGAELVDPLDVASIRAGILKVLQDQEHRERLIREGRENAKRFDGDRIARQYLAVYQQIWDKCRGKG